MRAERRLAYLVIVLAFLSCASPPPRAPTPVGQPAEAPRLTVSSDSARRAAALLTRELASLRFPHACAALVERGAPPITVQLGDVAPHALYRSGELTELAVDATLDSLVASGKLAWTTRVDALLPEVDAAFGSVSVAMLARHLSGAPPLGNGSLDYAHRDSPLTESELLHAFDGARLMGHPGERTAVSPLGFALLGPMIARAGHEPSSELVRKLGFRALGWEDARWDDDAGIDTLRARGFWIGDEGAFVPARDTWRLGEARAMGGAFISCADAARLAAWSVGPSGAWDADRASQEGAGERAIVFGLERETDSSLGTLYLRASSTGDYAAAIAVAPSIHASVVLLAGGGDESGALGCVATRALRELGGPAGPGNCRVLQQDRAAFPDSERAEMRDALLALRALLRHPHPGALADRVFTAAFLAQVPPPKVDRFFRTLGASAGACVDADIRGRERDGRTLVYFICAYQMLEIRLSLERAAPHRIDDLVIHSRPR